MKKLLTLLGSFILGINSSIIVVGCNNNSVKISKHEMTKANLDSFFATNNSFSYKGPSFFKDKKHQESEKNKNINFINIFIINVFENIISENVKDNFKNFFSLNKNYIFNIFPDYSKNVFDIDAINNFNENEEYKFKIEIRINKKDGQIFYLSNWLTINFCETKQYEPKEWLKRYKDFLISQSRSVFHNIISWDESSTVISHHIKDSDWKHNSELIKKYQSDNISEVLKNIEDNINDCIDVNKTIWQIYKENVFKISSVNSYRYIATVYNQNNHKEISKIIENVNITISYDPKYSPYSYSQTFDLNINCL